MNTFPRIVLVSIFAGLALSATTRSANAITLLHTTCVRAQEYCNGGNVFVTCGHEDGSSEIYSILAQSGIDQSTVGNRNALVLNFISREWLKGKKAAVLSFDYVPNVNGDPGGEMATVWLE